MDWRWVEFTREDCIVEKPEAKFKSKVQTPLDYVLLELLLLSKKTQRIKVTLNDPLYLLSTHTNIQMDSKRENRG